ncbi:MAG TPA: hypothetical protein PLB63_09450 [Planctomycetota bacterium]|nr:hypothetical protein [Planctomycetota bacterium]HQB01384.1 hypothetical protein [Planctomycetota bacterium]
MLRGETQANLLWGKYVGFFCSGEKLRRIYSGENMLNMLCVALLLWGETHAYSGKVSVALGRNELERNAK